MLYFKPVAASMGYSRYPENIGSMINRGVEVDLHSKLIETKDFTWDINLNLTHVKNKINELAPELKGELIDGSRIYREGESMYQLYLPKFVGVDPETGESMWALKKPNDKGETTTKSILQQLLTALRQAISCLKYMVVSEQLLQLMDSTSHFHSLTSWADAFGTTLIKI